MNEITCSRCTDTDGPFTPDGLCEPCARPLPLLDGVQPAFDGMPTPPPTDYETWRDDGVWEAFVKVAKSGAEFLCWQVAKQHELPAPGDPRFWARLIGELQRHDVIRFAGYGDARDGSACKRWTGTRAAMSGRAA